MENLKKTAGDAGGLEAEGRWRDETWPAGPCRHGDAWMMGRSLHPSMGG